MSEIKSLTNLEERSRNSFGIGLCPPEIYLCSRYYNGWLYPKNANCHDFPPVICSRQWLIACIVIIPILSIRGSRFEDSKSELKTFCAHLFDLPKKVQKHQDSLTERKKERRDNKNIPMPQEKALKQVSPKREKGLPNGNKNLKP